MRNLAWTLAGLVAAFLAIPGTTLAQALGPRAPEQAFQFRIGGFFPEGGGPLWDDNEARFTLDVDDFNDATVGFTYSTGISNYWEVGFNVDFYDNKVLSEERDFVDADLLPIFHDTRLEMVPLSVDVRLLPSGRYRMRSGGVRVLKPVFYVGAGVGANFWEYSEVGDFVDDTDPLDPFIFFDRFKESGLALQTHLLAGGEFPLSPRFNLTVEGRYAWADDRLDGDLASFDRIELGGASVFVGGAFRF